MISFQKDNWWFEQGGTFSPSALLASNAAATIRDSMLPHQWSCWLTDLSMRLLIVRANV